ncbi:hypothetical protein HMPREF9413_5320 [Paenibacillus sp. HGF7]|nr:hypothetical protein HMPREF9413_5320 [Paenibacillus sp. HGF7]
MRSFLLYVPRAIAQNHGQGLVNQRPVTPSTARWELRADAASL